jgi:hypothetical protein
MTVERFCDLICADVFLGQHFQPMDLLFGPWPRHFGLRGVGNAALLANSKTVDPNTRDDELKIVMRGRG